MMEFRGEEAISMHLERVGFKDVTIKTESRQKTYSDLWDLLHTLKSIGAGNKHGDGDKSLARGALLKDVSRVYKENFPSPDNRGIVATYEVVFAAARA
jgi:hypothetical protein